MNQEITLSFRALCRTVQLKGFRPDNLEKALLYITDGQKKENLNAK